MTLKELIQRAIDVASNNRDMSAMKGSIETVAEPMLALIFANVSARVAADSGRRSFLRRTNTLTFTNGVAPIPETVLTQYLCESLLLDTALPTSRYSWISQFSELVRVSDPRLGYYSANESSMFLVQPAAIYAPGVGLSGTLALTTPCSIAMPTVITDPVVVRDELIDDLVEELATAIRQDMPPLTATKQ
jgi:hypothetical protein